MSCVAESAGIAAAKAHDDWAAQTSRAIRPLREKLKNGLEALGFSVKNRQANFLCFHAPGYPDLEQRLPKTDPSAQLRHYEGLGPEDYRRRCGQTPKMPVCCRPERGSQERNTDERKIDHDTGNHVQCGKSFVAAGFAGFFHQDGYRTAPFKSQNMALEFLHHEGWAGNGPGTGDAGGGRRCGAPVEMNPILLKPTSNMGSQVIVNGEVLENMRAMDYYRRKPEFIPAVKQAYEKLASDYDVIVLEGAAVRRRST